MFLSTTLFALLVVCLMVLVNCLLNAFAICLCMVAVFVVFLVWVSFLFPSPCIVVLCILLVMWCGSEHVH